MIEGGTEGGAKRIVAGERDGLPEILQALRSTAGDRATIVIPAESGLFLTASEFRALKKQADQVGVTVTVETDDRLRRQLAQMFTVAWEPLPIEPPVVRTPTAWPAQPSDAPADVEEDAAEPPEDPGEAPVDLKTSKPWRADVIDVSSHTSLPPPPSMIPERIDDLAGLPKVDLGRRRGGRSRLALVGGALAAVLILGLLGSVLLRSATVRVTLRRQTVTSEVRFGVRSEGVEQVAGAAFMVDGGPVAFEAAYTTTVPVTGTVTEQTAPATGTLQLRNIGGEAVTVPSGTELTSRDGLRYRTTAEAALKAGSTDAPASGSVAIESVTGGDAADAEVGTLVGPLDGFEGVYYANLDGPVAGGVGKESPGVSAEDKDALVALAQTELDEQAAATTVPGAGLVVPSTVVPDGGISFTLDHEVGEAVAEVTIQATHAYEALAVDPAAVTAQADGPLRAGIQANVPSGYELDPASVQIGATDAASDADAGLMRIAATAEARATLDDDERERLSEAISGDSVDDARAEALANPDVADVAIEVSPGWPVGSLPSAGRVKVTTT